MFGLGKYAQIWFYIEHSISFPVLSLWIKSSQLFRNCMRDATDRNSFGLGLTAINKVHKYIYIVYINYDIIYFFYLRFYYIVDNV